MAYDVSALKERADLLALAGADTRLRKVAASEWAGPCPKCGGKDRFHVTAAWWFCRQCHDKRGDVIEYLRWRDGLGFGEACEALGGQKAALQRPGLGAAIRDAGIRAPEPEPVPCAAWQERARVFLAYTQGELWRTPEALAYLRGRGLTDETIRAAGLGYNPKRQLYDDPARWGLDGKRLWLPPGWVILCEQGGELRYVKVRRPDADLGPDDDKYHSIRGSRWAGVIYGLDDLRGQADAILCEGEFDALVLRQAVGDLCGVAALPGVSGRAGPQAVAVLATVRRLWAAMDTDRPGEAARERWGELAARVRPLAPPAHDWTDAWKAGVDLAAWVVAVLGAREPVPPERAAARERQVEPAPSPVDSVLAALVRTYGRCDWVPAAAPEGAPDWAAGHVFYRAGGLLVSMARPGFLLTG